jgi:hypothetical protein
VHVAFCEPLTGEFNTPEEIALAIDSSIALNYHLHTTNLAAHALTVGLSHPSSDALQQRFAGLTLPQKDYALAMYANPVLRQQQFNAAVVG